MTRRKQKGPIEGAFLLAHHCCTFTPASRCNIAPALTSELLGTSVDLLHSFWVNFLVPLGETGQQKSHVGFVSFD